MASTRGELYKLIMRVNMDDSFRQTWNVDRFIDEVEAIYHPASVVASIEEQAKVAGYRPAPANLVRDDRSGKARFIPGYDSEGQY